VKITVIGGGAAGFFAAIQAATANPAAEVSILEKSQKLLSKVLVSGGGRCNVTHATFDIKQLSQAYPRGDKQLRSAFSRFMTTDTIAWFEARKVKLKTEQDGRMFPVTDDSATIADCLLREAKKRKIEISMGVDVKRITQQFHGGFVLQLQSGGTMETDKVIIACGGAPREGSLDWLAGMGHQIVEPVPSLFTFNMPGHPITELTGISMNPVKVKIVDSKLDFSGPLLITHWGLSGPAILRLSAFGARLLAERDYKFHVQVGWLNDKKEDATRQVLFNLKAANPARHILTHFPFVLPARLLAFLLERAGITDNKKWGDISKDDINSIANVLLYDTYEVSGKTTFKEEFVTCGGVSLNDVDFKTMESRKVKGLYFAGEVLDIDGITGGFNFQAAWTTGFIAGSAAAGGKQK
jgi:predicted Rossmann fold flavoprotein